MKAYARRDGNIATVFVDGGGQPMHIQSYDQEPAGFPRTMQVNQLEQAFPMYEFVYLTPDQTSQPEGIEIPDELVSKFMKDINAQPLVPRTLQVAPNGASNFLEDKLFKEFSSMLLSLKSLKGREQKEMKRDIEAVGSFLLTLDPSYEERLKELSIVEENPKKRFQL